MTASIAPQQTTAPVLGVVNPNKRATKASVVSTEGSKTSDHTATTSSTAFVSRRRPVIISVEAAIGTGKSSLLRLLQRTVGSSGKWIVVQEPVEQWQTVGGKHNLLEAYYSNQERYAFSFQTNCVLSRIKALQQTLSTVPEDTEVIVLERCWQSDRNTFGEMLRRQNKISELEWALYNEWYRFAVENAPFVDGHVYLEACTETCMSRLRKRDRSEEVGVTAQYQKELIECHEQWLQDLPEQERVCRIGVDQEFVNDQDNARRVVGTIEQFVADLLAMRP